MKPIAAGVWIGALTLAAVGGPAAACSRGERHPPSKMDPGEFVFSGRVVAAVSASRLSYRWFWFSALIADRGRPWAIRVVPDEVVQAPQKSPAYDIYLYAYDSGCVTVPVREDFARGLIGKHVRVVASPSTYVADSQRAPTVRLEVSKNSGFVVWESTGRYSPSDESFAWSSGYELRIALKRLAEAPDDDAREATLRELAAGPRYRIPPDETGPRWHPLDRELERLIRSALKDPERARRLDAELMAGRERF